MGLCCFFVNTMLLSRPLRGAPNRVHRPAVRSHKIYDLIQKTLTQEDIGMKISSILYVGCSAAALAFAGMGAAGGRRPDRARIAHIGLGNFHRAHQAWYTAAAPDWMDWGIAAFSGRTPAQAELAGRPGRAVLLAVIGATATTCSWSPASSRRSTGPGWIGWSSSSRPGGRDRDPHRRGRLPPHRAGRSTTTTRSSPTWSYCVGRRKVRARSAAPCRSL